MIRARARVGGLVLFLTSALAIAIAARGGCSSASPAIAPRAPSADAPPPVSSAQGFGEACAFDVECATGYCNLFLEHGKRCSQPCVTTKDCPKDSDCNRRGFCK